jgi:DNA-binding transcriptional regulator YbjK
MPTQARHEAPTRATRKAPTQATPEAPTRPRGSARRELLLDAVLAIVAERGTDAVTHRRVAEVAELPLASTTYWFESREHLLTAAFERAAERDIARLGEQSTADRGAPPLERAVRAVVGAPNETCSRSSLITVYALMLEAARRPELQAISQRWTDAYLDTVGGMLAEAGSERPREDAELMLAAADGLLIEQLSSGTHTDLEPQVLRLARGLLEAS